MRGVRWGGGLQFFITLVKVTSLLAILVLPFVLWSSFDAPTEMRSRTTDFTWSGLGVAFLAVLWPYHGWMNVAPIAGEVKKPQRNIPIAFLAGTGIIVLLYLGANLAYHLVIPQDTMAALPGNVTVVSYFGQSLLGPIGALLASAVVMISVFGALNGNILVGPRLLYAMGEDGMAPRALSRLHAQYRTPVLAIAVLVGWSGLLVILGGVMTDLPGGKSLFDTLTDFSMFGAVIFETLAVATIFVFRRKLAHVERAYRCPWYPLVPLLYMVVPVYVLVDMLRRGATEAAIGLGFIGSGVAVYYAFLAGKGASAMPRSAPPGDGGDIDSNAQTQ
jgi:amino acid transporter